MKLTWTSIDVLTTEPQATQTIQNLTLILYNLVLLVEGLYDTDEQILTSSSLFVLLV